MPYGQKYSLSWCSKLNYPLNDGLLNRFTARIFQDGYISGGGIQLTPSQLDSFSGRLGGINMVSTGGTIVMQWTTQLIDLYGSYPLIWCYYDGQGQPLFPQLDDTDNPTEITLDTGATPATNIVIIIKKPDSETLDASSGSVTIPIPGFQVIWVYSDNAFQPSIAPVLDDNDAPTTATFDLGTPSTNSYIELLTPDVLSYTPAEILGTGGIITIPANASYGANPKFYAIYDSRFQPINPVVTPSSYTIDLGATPSTNTHVLILSGGTAVGIQALEPTGNPCSINSVGADPRDKMQPLKGSEATLRVVNFDLEEIWTDDETEYYAEIQRETDEDTFTVNWSNNDISGTVESFLQVYKNNVLIVNSFSTESGSFQVTRGDNVSATAYSVSPWPTPQSGLQLEFSGLPTLRTTTNGTPISRNNIDILYDTTIAGYSTNTDPNYQAIRSEVFYNATSGFPVTFTKSYTGVDQATADALAAADTTFYTEGQSFADSYPIGFPAIWRGFMIPDGLQQSWQEKAVLEINFVDGIGLLKNLLFVDNSGNFFLGKMTPKDIIYNCLYRLGIPDMNIYIRSEIVEESMDVAEDPMTQVKHQLETYFLSTQTKPLDLAVVAASVLRNYGLELRQNLGEWWITQMDVLFDPGGGDWFKYSYRDGTYLETVTKDFTLEIGCSAGVFDNIFANSDQLKAIDKAYRGQILRYEFKSAQNINSNPNLIPTPSGPGYIWDGWTVDPLGSGNVNPGAGGNGARMDSDAIRPADPPEITMTSDTIAVDDGDFLIFNLNFNNTGPVAFGKFEITFTNAGNIYYLLSDGSWQLTTPNPIYTYNGQVLRDPAGPVPPGDYLWALDSDLSIEIIAESIPGALPGDVRIILYNYDYSQNNSLAADEQNTPGFPTFSGTTTWNLAKASFAVSPNDQGLVAAGTFYIARNIGNFTFTPEILSVLNADDDTAKYVGTLYRADDTTPTSSWRRLSQVYEDKPLLWIITENYVRMYQKHFRICTGTIGGWFPQLSRFTIEGWEGVYMSVGANYDLGTLLIGANLIEFSNEDITGAPDTVEETDYGQYSDDLPVL